MFRISAIRTLTLLTLLSLGGPAAVDAAPRPGPRPTPGGAWSLASSLWYVLASFAATDAGCMIDPEGRCENRPGAAVATTDEGCTIDPVGRCESRPGAAVTATDEGCMIDPYGLCKK